ncbi:MAG: hypothetical protein IT293_18805 [Deltaproteobacteria bacterium]|nr:hypothetical protein [Deltaproteobacteria bacterium]
MSTLRRAPVRSSGNCLLNYRSLIPILVAASVVVCSPSLAFADGSSEQPSTSAGTARHIVLRPGESRFRMLPLTNYVNTAFDTAQVSRAFSQRDYWHNHERVIDRIADPIDSIEDDGGWDHLVNQELLSPHVLPNLTLHLLGNGYDFRALAEWFDEHDVPFAYFWAFLASYAGYLGNEAIEVSNPEVDATDSIADLYFFNLLGNLLFISDTVTDVVHNDMQFRNWPGQPVFDVRHHKILNASNNYLMRPRVFGEKVRPFLYFGLQYFGGVSVLLPSEKSLSLGVGLATVDPFADSIFDKVRPSGGVYWDDHDRLLASMTFNGTDDSIVRLNLYPDIFHFRTLDLGVFLGVAGDGVPTFGIAIQKLLALGFS